MAYDIFSSFDPQNKTMPFLWPMMWLGVILLLDPRNKWASKNNKNSISVMGWKMTYEMTKSSPAKSMNGTMGSLSTTFLLIIFINLWGLAPYVFSLSTHMAINLTLALPAWLSLVMMGLSYNFMSALAHLTPSGSPSALNPLMCITETVGLIIRPITLSVRLTANMSAGHILMGLMGMAMISSTKSITILVTAIGTGYFLVETAICIIQAYIFTLLTTMYSNDHPQ